MCVARLLSFTRRLEDKPEENEWEIEIERERLNWNDNQVGVFWRLIVGESVWEVQTRVDACYWRQGWWDGSVTLRRTDEFSIFNLF